MNDARECGDCTACCTILGVDELHKGTYCICPHSITGKRGCAIYSTRPRSCRDFSCLWLDGTFQLDAKIDPVLLRPDKLGIVFEFQDGSVFGQIVKMWEVWDRAIEGDLASGLRDMLAEQFLVVVMNKTTRKLYGPPDRLDEAKRVMRAAGVNPKDHGIQ